MVKILCRLTVTIW